MKQAENQETKTKILVSNRLIMFFVIQRLEKNSISFVETRQGITANASREQLKKINVI